MRVDISDRSRLPTFAGAVGRYYAALRDLPREELRARCGPPRWQSPLTFQAYAKDVEQARCEGYAFDFGDLFRGLEIAVVTDASGKLRLSIGGISIAGQLARKEIDRLGVELRNSADFISETLFGASRGATIGATPRWGKAGAARKGRKMMPIGSDAPLWVFDSFRPGALLGRVDITLDQSRIANWTAIYGLPQASERIPSGMLVAAMMEAYLRAIQPRPPGNVHVGQKLTFGKPVHTGDRLEAEVSCLSKEVRKERCWVTFGVVLRKRDGDVLQGEIRSIWAK